MLQTLETLLAAKKTARTRNKSVIQLVNEESDSKSDSSDSDFKKRPSKKAKTVKADRKAEKSVEKQVAEKTEHLSVASS
eukprot:8310469-Ditylum_brightwellii.AAC.2